MLAEYGEFYYLPAEEKAQRTGGELQGIDWNIPMLSTAMVAYAAARRQDAGLARLAWDILLGDNSHWHIGSPLEARVVPPGEYVRPIREIPWISTNTASQWSINLIVCMELIGEWMPENKSQNKPFGI